LKLGLPVDLDEHLPADTPRFVRVSLKMWLWMLWLHILLVIPVGLVLLVIVFAT
jgi:hypothetical protein